jgi:NAD(P)-dependent dehydrogenase (short-subunit alcohol dehydrogenase family)
MASEIEMRLGPIEVWVNNAGVSKIAPFLECTEEPWDTIIRVSLKGTLNGCKAAIARILPRRRGSSSTFPPDRESRARATTRPTVQASSPSSG